MNVTMRAERDDDAQAIHEITALAFGRDNEARLVAALRAGATFIPELSLVALVEGRCVAHVLFSQIAIRAPDRSVPALALAPLAVHPDVQNRSVGSTLVRHGLDECRRLGHQRVIVIGHPRYYPRFGFEPARAFGLEAPFPVRDAAFMAVALVAGAFAGARGTVEYPPAFNGV